MREIIWFLGFIAMWVYVIAGLVFVVKIFFKEGFAHAWMVLVVHLCIINWISFKLDEAQ